MTTSISDPSTPEDLIRREALALGFDDCRFARADRPWAAGERLFDFIAEGRHGQMSWMETTAERRAHPQAMWAGARSAVLLGVNYGPEADPRAVLSQADRGAISVYAQGSDYHDLIKKRLKRLASWMVQTFGGEVKVFVDTAPLLEKPLAEASGLGWQGKHTNLVSRQFGSWLFIGSVLTSLELAPDAAGEDACGSCRACQDACPTDAFPAPYQLDARRCISYLTIELAGPIPREFRQSLGNRIYGCDDCLAVCPWNKFAQTARETQLQARAALQAPRLEDLARLDDAAFRALFTKSAVKRLGRDRFVRNVLYAVGNSGEPGLVDVVRERLSDAAPVVRGAAVWALSQLLPADAFSAERALALLGEADETVRGEWALQAD
ncbi:MAG: tRNA epoxyqueuosine(34) reductase QueG [Phenylobacterium sp.]|uniref:tRNA epoxyqueuosine(34) reductase QueG n=1 Tax=Phenylobacterium sp. TaxID=1871053 RepID=UPI00179949A6|nr:tRNA epoxyqueuosine(34) reductase QueG [Phenylobacterium sp.]MBA4793686.1 tRNA epoxyqueuosine(34) reductase QueG [Phenylobacterium sp.]